MTQLTEAQKAFYLEHHGATCPVCGSMNISNTQSVQTDLGVAWQKIECGNCGAEFVDLYELVGVRGSEDLV